MSPPQFDVQGSLFESLGAIVPQAVKLVKYHLGWKLAPNLRLSEGGFHVTTLV
jgi:hypothetical protein